MEEISIVRTNLLNQNNWAIQYDELVRKNKKSLFYMDRKYHSLLVCTVPNVNPIYILAIQNNKVIGALPVFSKKAEGYGTVLNSLPFYGSNGGIILDSEEINSGKIKAMLLKEFKKMYEEEGVLSATIIENPLMPDEESIVTSNNVRHIDFRIGQFTALSLETENSLEDKLMSLFHYKTRNMIRKGQKNNFSIYHSGSLDDFKSLYKIHCENMKTIGGLEKPWELFKGIHEIYTYDKDYRIYVAERNGQIAAALLLIYFNNIVEYYTPAINHDFRPLQPLSALIFQSMLDALKRGFKLWNWGGTWPSQESVYRFKKRWGAMDKNYNYYTFARDTTMVTKEVILKEFPYFFVLPFSAL